MSPSSSVTSDAVEPSVSAPRAFDSSPAQPSIIASTSVNQNAIATTVATESTSPAKETETSRRAELVMRPGAITSVQVGLKRRMMQQREHAHIQVVERWQGVVERVTGESFSARVISSGGAASWPEEDGEFSLSLVSDDDLELVQPGAFFTYSVVRETRHGTRRSSSVLVFRRMPMWHLRQVADAKRQGEELADRLARQSTQSFDRPNLSAAGD